MKNAGNMKKSIIDDVVKIIKEDALYNPMAAEVSIEALSKQIPTKPVRNTGLNELWSSDSMLCPKCFAYVNVWGNQYCGRCGQRIDWGNGNDES